MKNLPALLSKNYRNSSRRFVFPSQVAADFWRRRLLDAPDIMAVEWDRFLSWDSFKESLFDVNRRELPANQRVRRLFCADLLARYAKADTPQDGRSGRSGRPGRSGGAAGENGTFRVLLNPEFRESAGAFQSYLASILPELRAFWDGPAAELAGAGGAGSPAGGPASGTGGQGIRNRLLLEDLRYLTDEYRRFLEERGFYEPSWERPAPGRDGNGYLIFFPELIEDFREFRESLARWPEAELVRLEDLAGLSGEPSKVFPEPVPGTPDRPAADHRPGEELPALFLYPRSREEAESFCLRLGELLDRGAGTGTAAGTGAGDVVVTLADPELRPLLEHTARIYNVPLNFRAGGRLADSPEGQLFSRLRTCRDENFSLGSMKALLLNRAYPWKEPRLAERLAAFGGENYCFRNLAAGGGAPPRDIWEQALRRHKKDAPGDGEELERFYLSFRNQARRLWESRDFRELSRNLEVFLRSFLDTDAWDPPGLAVLQRIRLALGELVLLEGRLAGLETPGPLDFFIQDLESRNYVPQEDQPGIPVFDYRVSAGILPARHFVLGLSQRASEVERPAFSFLPEDLRGFLDPEEGRLDRDFLGAYGVSGEEVILSCAAESSLGPELVPRGFRVLPGALPGEAGLPEDPYLGEAAFWAGERKDLPETFTPVQALGLGRAGDTVFCPGRLDLTRRELDEPAVLAEVLARLSAAPGTPLETEAQEGKTGSGAPGPLRVSATRLDAWKFCPFAFLLEYVFGLEELPREARWESPQELGNLRHRILQGFFENLGDRPFLPEDRETHRELMEKTTQEVFRCWENRKAFSLSPLWNQFQGRLRRELGKFLAAEDRTFSGWRAVFLEKEYSLVLGDLMLSGRVDRVSEKDGFFLLVDYKSRLRLGESSLVDSQGNPFSYQMPIYLFLLEEQEGPVGAAAYYVFSENRYRFFLKDAEGGQGREKAEDLKEKTREALEDYRASAFRGDWRAPEECAPCAYRPVCRTRYVLRGEAT